MKNTYRTLLTLNEKPALRWYWLLAITVVVFIPNLFISYAILQDTIMPDLHIRILGSRWMDIGRSPYFSQWQPGFNEHLYNPNIFMPNGVNGVTVTPTVLWLQTPLSRLSYCSIIKIWWLIMEMLLFATLFLTCLIPIKLNRQLVTLLVGSLFFCYSRNWWLHVYNGQLYIFYAFVFALTACLVIRYKKRFVVMLIFPLVAITRPFFALATVPWFINFNRKRRLKFIVSFMMCLGLVAYSAPLSTWAQYSRAMREYSKDIIGSNSITPTIDYRKPGLKPDDCLSIKPVSKDFKSGNLLSVQHYLFKLGFKWHDPALFISFLLLAIISLIIITKQSVINSSNENLFIFSFVLYIMAELFTPALRNPYNIVQYLGILGLFMQKANMKLIMLFVAGLLLNLDYPVRLAYQREVGEGIFLLAVYLSLFTTNKPSAAISK